MAQTPTGQGMKILISGARGLLGKRLSCFFKDTGSTVLPITRVATDQAIDAGVAWNPQTAWFDRHSMENAEAVIHLAGENVGDGLWTKGKKERIFASRIEGTQQLVSAIAKLEHPPKTLFCASATGFYGYTGDLERLEHDAAGEGFLATVCAAWENEANKVAPLGTRPILLRFGVILDPAGGALKKMILPFRIGLGGRIGSGQQYFPWIAGPEIPHIIDALIHRYPDLTGPVNMVAPQSVTNAAFTQALASHLRRPALLPFPAFMVKTLFGKMGREMLLGSCRAIPSVLSKTDYSFAYPSLEATFDAILPKDGSTMN